MEDTYVQMINYRLHLFLSSTPTTLAPNFFFSFSNHLGAVFIFFLLLSLPLCVLQCHHDGDSFFSEYDRSNWLFYEGYYLDIITDIKGRKTEWLEHVSRMKTNWISKMILNLKLDSKRRIGRPRTRHVTDEEKNIC